MKLQHPLKKVIVLSFAFILMSYSAVFAMNSNDYSFKVTNKTDTRIKKLLASEDGEKYGFFDIGSGLAAGKTMTLTWDKSTDESGCEWYFKAVYVDDSESEAVPFDFCEENLELVFE